MIKMFLRFLICITVFVSILIVPCMAGAEDIASQGVVDDDGNEAVTLELKNGEKVVVFIIRQTSNELFVRNLSDSMEVSVPRSKVVNIRKPTKTEIQKVQKTLGIGSQEQPSFSGSKK